MDDREFPVVRKGYDIGLVKAYLSEVEASFREWERWAEEARIRIDIAEEKARDTAEVDEVDEAMIAVFAAKDRIVEQGRLRAEQIEAEARERARVDYEDAAGAIIREAEEQARRIVQEAREEADRVFVAARDEAEGLIAQAQANAPMSQDRSGDALVVDLTDRHIAYLRRENTDVSLSKSGEEFGARWRRGSQ